jgi:hypothetical protein
MNQLEKKFFKLETGKDYSPNGDDDYYKGAEKIRRAKVAAKLCLEEIKEAYLSGVPDYNSLSDYLKSKGYDNQ